MKLSTYARVGKAPLMKSIGVQENHKIKTYTESRELDRTASGCLLCPNYKNVEYCAYLPEEIQAETKSRCEHCPAAVYKTVVHESYRYVNERNIFGNAPRLTGIALKLLVIYHFANPDEHGTVRGLSPKELAEYLGCSVRSIRNANLALQKYGYILYAHDGLRRHAYQVMLAEYASYALPASQGGRGYATLNRACLDELVKIKDLNQLRIFLRTVLEMDTSREPDTELVMEKEYSALRRFLPRYCKPGVIRRALSSVSALFSVRFDDAHVYLQMAPSCHGRRNFEADNDRNTAQIRDYFTALDAAMDEANRHLLKKSEPAPESTTLLADAGIHSRHKIQNARELFAAFHLDQKSIRDLGVLCTAYSFEEVRQCIGYVYEKYQVHSRIENLAALIRTILKDGQRHKEISRLFA